MTTENLEKKCKNAILRIDSNVREIRHILNYMAESRKYYYTSGYDKHSEYD